MFIFSEERRPKLQQERPDLSDSELTRLLARMWNELPDKKKVGGRRPPSHVNCRNEQTVHRPVEAADGCLFQCCSSVLGEI